MKFLLNVYADHVVGDALWDVERDRTLDNADFVAAARESGELIDSRAVADPSTGAVVRVRDGVAIVADGPYLDSPMQLTSYYLIDCEDRERAIELAATIPAAGHDAIEVRPVMLATGLEM